LVGMGKKIAMSIKQPILLELKGLSKNFEGLKALDKVDLTLKKGVIKALIGPNGAGKTTLFNVVTGLIKPSAGQVIFLGMDITGKKPFQISKLGIARTFQNIRLFNNLTVLENVMIGAHNSTKANFLAALFRLPSLKEEERKIKEKACEILDFVGLSHCLYLRAGSLPYGQQRLLEMARALAAKPQLLLLDEPTAGMNLTETAELTRIIKRVRDLGVTIFLVEHRMKVVMGISDEVAVLDYGVKITEGTPEEIRNDERVIRAYLGEKRSYKEKELAGS